MAENGLRPIHATGKPDARPKRILRKRGMLLRWLELHVDHNGDECLVWPFGRHKTGYPNVVRFQSKNVSAHRIMCWLKNGAPPTPEHEAAHSCGGGKAGCVHPKHLRWATSIENADDRWSHGTMAVGRSRLTKEQVLAIYERRLTGTRRGTAREFGVDRNVVHRIWSGVSWHWLTGAPIDRNNARRQYDRLARARRRQATS